VASEIIRTNVRVILGTKVWQPDTGDLLLPYQRRRNSNSLLTEKRAWYVSGSGVLSGCHSHLIYQTEPVARTSGINAGNKDVQPMDDTVGSPNTGPDGMVVDPEGHFKSPRPSIPLPNPIEEPSPLPPPPSLLPPLLTRAGRPMRNYKLPARYIDINPEPLRPLDEKLPPPTSILPRVVLIVRNRLRTATNSFNLLREYLYRPSFDPDSFVPPEDLLASHERIDALPTSPPILPLVHRNQSVELLMNWKDSGPPTKSDSEINRLVDEVLFDPNFSLEDLRGFRAARENRRIDMADENAPFLDSFQKQQLLKSKFHQAQRMYLLQNSLFLDCVFAKYLLSSEPCLHHLWHQNFIYLLSNYSTRLQVAKKNVSFAKSMTQMHTLKRTTRSSMHQCHLMIQTANARRQWQYSCFGRTPPTWQILERPNSGPSTCSSETF
jgi:hypothetical protein